MRGKLLAPMILAGLLGVVGCDQRPNRPGHANETGMRIANAYGFENWDRIESIHFTFNVDSPDRDEPVERQWSWSPDEDRVTFHGEEEVTYRRSELGDDPPEYLKEVDHNFINDHYWLLFPFQPVWSDPTVTDEGMAEPPIGEGEAPKMTVQYPPEGGYTPGDAYDLYLDEHDRIREWVFRRGGQADGRAFTWEGHHQLGPIVVSLDHWGADEAFHLWFSDVRAVLENGEEVTAEAL
jgi:hypothetical protein